MRDSCNKRAIDLADKQNGDRSRPNERVNFENKSNKSENPERPEQEEQERGEDTARVNLNFEQPEGFRNEIQDGDGLPQTSQRRYHDGLWEPIELPE